MYLKAGDEYADQELLFLSELLNDLDKKVVEVSNRIAKSPESESNGLTDRGEYFIGVGFCVIQQYCGRTT